MRNLKKVLSLVLCVAMLLSVMVMGTGAAFTDEDDFSPQYAEAAEVLAGMKVMQGYDDGSFLPQRNITRAQVATMIYRAATSDVTDTQTPIYADYDKFDDVQSDDWFAGYVNYCGNAELIKGFTPTTFGPNKNVTGYQVLAMILRAVGYDANDEFTGSGWEIRTASTAQQLGMLDNVQEATLGQPATRELVAELIFQALNVNMVKYMPAAGYVKQDTTLGEQEFDLTKGDRTTIDEWGRPGYNWTYNTGDKSTTIEEAALATYQTAVTECDVADDTNDRDTTYDLYVNSKTSTQKYTVQATDTVNKIGAQGRQTEVYSDRIVMIDTMLAQVTNVTNYKADSAGHVYTPATLELKIFDQDSGDTTVTLKSYTSNYSYTKGEMLLVNTYTDATNSVTGHGNAINNADTQHVEIVGSPTSVVGSQTVIHYNDGKHTVNGTEYVDAACLHLDQAQKETTQHTWYFDLNNNLIGVTDIQNQYTYGTIKNLQWINPQGSAGYAQATIVYMDGSEQTETLSSLNGDGLTYVTTGTAPGDKVGDKFAISTSMTENDAFCATASGLYRIAENSDGSVSLQWVNSTGIVPDGGRLNNSTIRTTVSAIAGTAEAPSTDGTIYTDSATQYLVRTGDPGKFVYTPVTGLNNVANYNGSTVDYIDVDNDNRADYVFFFGTAVDYEYDGLFYLTTTSYQEYLMEDNKTVDYYVLTGYVNGELGNIKIDGADFALVERIINAGVNKLWEVEFSGDYVDGIVNDITTAVLIDNVGVYADLNAVLCDATSTAKATFANDVLLFNGNAYNVTTATRVYGELSDVMDNHNIYVVYDANNYAKEIYVSDKAYNPVEPDADKATFVYSVTMEYKTGYVTTRTASTQVADGYSIPAGSQAFNVVAPIYWPDIQVANWDVLTDTSMGQSTFNAVGGNVYTYSYYIQAK